MRQRVVSIKRLHHFFAEGSLRKQVLFDINLDIYPQEFVILTGPSGSGKSTLLSLVGCLRSVQTGSLQVLEQELRGVDKRVMTEVRRNFGYITQSSNLLHFLTAQQNVQMALELNPTLVKKEREARAKSMLEAVGLGKYLRCYPNNLSGGQRQRVAIASALVTQPKLILADEPTAALDRKSGRNVVTLMHRLAKDQGSAVLMVTHDNRILDLADRIINVEDGRLGFDISHELALLFPGIDTNLLDRISVRPTVHSCMSGEVLRLSSDRASNFYVILSGEVDIFQERIGHSARRLRHMKEGEYFSGIGFLQAEQSVAIQATTEEANLVAIEQTLFRAMIASSNLAHIDIDRRLVRQAKPAAV